MILSWQYVSRSLVSKIVACRKVLACLSCVAIMCCRGHENNHVTGAPTGAEALALVAGMASAAAVIKAGSALDALVVEALTNPQADPNKKKRVRRLNRLYSLAKLGAIVGVARGLGWYLDQCIDIDDKGIGVVGAVSIAGLALTSLGKTVWI